MWLADPQFLAVERRRARQAVGRARRATAHAGLQLDGRARAADREQLTVHADALSGKPMADREPEIVARIAPGVASVAAAQWDALAGARSVPQPRLPGAARSSRAASADGTGWTPGADPGRGEDGRMAAAAPAYLKTHSQGEYVFDHGWADAWERAGGDYYPKLQIAVPFTPVPGRRLLGDRPQRAARRARGGDGAERPVFGARDLHRRARKSGRRGARLAASATASSITGSTAAMPSFDDFLGRACRAASARRSARSGRRRSRGWRSSPCAAPRSSPPHWDAMWHFYQDTGAPQMGPALSDPRVLRPGRRSDGRRGAAVPGARRTAGRSPARSTSSARTRSTAATGARSRRCRSSISS